MNSLLSAVDPNNALPSIALIFGALGVSLRIQDGVAAPASARFVTRRPPSPPADDAAQPSRQQLHHGASGREQEGGRQGEAQGQRHVQAGVLLEAQAQEEGGEGGGIQGQAQGQEAQGREEVDKREEKDLNTRKWDF